MESKKPPETIQVVCTTCKAKLWVGPNFWIDPASKGKCPICRRDIKIPAQFDSHFDKKETGGKEMPTSAESARPVLAQSSGDSAVEPRREDEKTGAEIGLVLDKDANSPESVPLKVAGSSHRDDWVKSSISSGSSPPEPLTSTLANGNKMASASPSSKTKRISWAIYGAVGTIFFA